MKLINKKFATAISGLLLMGSSGYANAGDVSVSIAYAIPGLFIGFSNGYSNHGHHHYSYKPSKHHHYRPYYNPGRAGYYRDYRHQRRQAYNRYDYRNSHKHRRHTGEYSYYRHR